jgi:signal transduction histidine kinase
VREVTATPAARPPVAGASTPSGPDTAPLLLSRFLTAGGLAFRFVSAPGSIIGFLGVDPRLEPQVVAVLAVVAVLGVANGIAAVLVLRGTRFLLPQCPRLLVLDLGVAVALNLGLALALPRGTANEEAYDVAWFYLIGAVATWTGVRGLRAGLVVMAVGVPLQLGMTAANRVPLTDQPWDKLVVREAWVAAGFALAAVALPLYRRGRRMARQEGLRAGREAERVRQLRELHDTVLQTLEAVALTAGDRSADPEDRLTRVRSAARAQAAEIRALLAQDVGDPPPPELGGALRHQLAAARDLGLEVQLVMSSPGAMPDSSPPVVDALRLAVGEALTNVAKHSGVRQVTVRVSEADGEVRISVADGGRGFDTSERSGFGIRESIVARMREVGGGADVWSLPGRGTVVTLSVPRERRAPLPQAGGRRTVPAA